MSFVNSTVFNAKKSVYRRGSVYKLCEWFHPHGFWRRILPTGVSTAHGRSIWDRENNNRSRLEQPSTCVPWLLTLYLLKLTQFTVDTYSILQKKRDMTSSWYSAKAIAPIHKTVTFSENSEFLEHFGTCTIFLCSVLPI